MSVLSEIRFVLTPVQDALAHDVVKTDGHEAQVNKHLPEPEEAGAAGERGQAAVDDGPGHHEDHFHVEQDEEDGDQIKAHTEAAAGVAHSLNAALINIE